MTHTTILGIMLAALTFASGPHLHAQSTPISQALRPTIVEKGVAAAVSQYHELKQKNAGQYDFSEAHLNALGYELIASDRLQEAAAVLQLNLEAYPESPNCYDSLGEVYLRMGERDKAIELYRQALAKLKTANLDHNTRQALENNAKAKLAYLQDPASYVQSTVTTDFLDNNPEHPFGRLHPKAPPETAHWGRLAGEWDCTIEALTPNGTWVRGGKAKWIWKYILDGFAVQDLWYQKWIDLPPGNAAINRDLAGTNIRMYLPAEKRWEVVWFVNSRNTTSRFEAISDDDQVVMTGENSNGKSRITFYNITESSFDWKSERSQDGGETWREFLRIHGKRVR